MKTITKSVGYIESFDGTPIYYEVRGEGHPVFLCYGIVCSMNHWDPQIKYFSNRYQLITFDYRGHHKSAKPKDPANISYDALARDIETLAKHLKITKASFWGHSFGVQMLLRAYDMYPDLFHSLVFLNGFASNPLKSMFGLDVVSSIFRFLKRGHEQLPETSTYLWKNSVNNPLTLRMNGWLGGFNLSLTNFKDIEIYARGVAGVDLDVFLKFMEQMINYDGTPVLDRIEVPTLIVGGTQDSVTPIKFQRILHSKIRGSEFQIVPYGSHCTQLDMPDFVNLKIEQFLSDQNYKPKK